VGTPPSVVIAQLQRENAELKRKLTVMKEILSFLDDMRENLARSPWALDKKPADWASWLVTESKEAHAEAAQEPPDPLKVEDELGDVFHNWLAAVLSHNLQPSNVVASAAAKMHRRKPWLFDKNLPQPTSAEEEAAWVKKIKNTERS